MSKPLLKNSAVAIVGYLLSPLSWWNDTYINLPIAYVLAIPFSNIHEHGFVVAMVFFYWVTNIVGLAMMHSAAKRMVFDAKHREDRKNELAKDLLISFIYTILVVALVQLDILKSPL